MNVLKLLAQEAGNAWAQGQPRHIVADELSHAAFLEWLAERTPDTQEGSEAFTDIEAGWLDGVREAKTVLLENDGTWLSVSEVATRAGVNRSYILAEIRAGRLKTWQPAREHLIHPREFALWMDNPRRGTRGK